MTKEQTKEALYKAEEALNEFLGDDVGDVNGLVRDSDYSDCIAQAERALANLEEILRAIERKEGGR